jgi:hypothetical protein
MFRCRNNAKTLIQNETLQGEMLQPGNRDRHVWTAPLLQGKSGRFGVAVGCGHVSGLFGAVGRPLALMKSAKRVPIKSVR